MINIDAALLHDFFEIMVGNGITKVEENGE